MSIVRLGTTKQYADNWDNIFGNGRVRATVKKKSANTAVKQKSAKKKPVKKARKKK
jgi:hypothetical protein